MLTLKNIKSPKGATKNTKRLGVDWRPQPKFQDTDGTRTGHGRNTDGTRTACERMNLTVVFMDFMGYPRSRICPCLVRVPSVSRPCPVCFHCKKIFQGKQDFEG